MLISAYCHILVAEAIEQSAVVLVCFSQRYKDSPNCRLEAEYCQTRKKRIIPILVQTQYNPDGWYFLYNLC